MALRPLDNALPITPERPKKQAKVSIATKKQSNFGAINDENIAPLPPPATTEAIDYISSDDLKALSDPDIKIQVIVSLMNIYDFCGFKLF